MNNHMKIMVLLKSQKKYRKMVKKYQNEQLENTWKSFEIKAQYVKPYTVTTKDSDFSSKLENVLNEQFNPSAPNGVWCTDITYLWTNTGFVYLTGIMDLYYRKIIAWTLTETLAVPCVIDTINKANKNRELANSVIIHSDRGSQYVSK